MSILADSARSAVFRDGKIIIAMEIGTEIRFAVAENPRLLRGTPELLSRILAVVGFAILRSPRRRSEGRVTYPPKAGSQPAGAGGSQSL